MVNSVTFNAVIVCDDVRRETSGKDILIGVYGSEIIVHTLPAFLTLAFWMEFTVRNAGELDIEFQIAMPSQANPPGVRATLTTESNAAPISFFTPQLLCTVEREGTIMLKFREGQEKKFQTIKSRRVRYVPVGEITPTSSNASQRPS